jgi:hypothetical protein
LLNTLIPVKTDFQDVKYQTGHSCYLYTSLLNGVLVMLQNWTKYRIRRLTKRNVSLGLFHTDKLNDKIGGKSDKRLSLKIRSR